MTIITTERMSDQFTKLHLQVGKFPITLHHFTGPDVGDPHDHPFAFTTTILKGCYLEEIWSKRANGVWFRRQVGRQEGTTHRVAQRCIHRIIALPMGECVTAVRWHDKWLPRREPRFYRLVEGVMQSRQWDEKWPEDAR